MLSLSYGVVGLSVALETYLPPRNGVLEFTLGALFVLFDKPVDSIYNISRI